MAPETIHFALISEDEKRFPSFSTADLTDGIETTLEAVRKAYKLPSKYAFTADKKASVPESTTLKYYISITPENHGKVYPKETPEEKVTVQDQYSLKQGSAALPQTPVVNIDLMLKVKPREKVAAPSAVNADLRTTLDRMKSDLEAKKWPNVADGVEKLAALQASQFAAQANSTEITAAAELSPDQWAEILFNVRAFHGYTSYEGRGVIKAPKPAFKLVPPEAPKDSKIGNVAKAYYEDLPGVPTFSVDDGSSVTITQNQTAFQESLAKEGFHSDSVSASVDASGWGMQASASASYENEKATANKSVEKSSLDSMTVAYNFPRVSIDLENSSIMATADCLADVAKLKANTITDQDFGNTWGNILTTSLTIGGRLHSTRKMSEFESEKTEDIKSSMKWAASVSFSAPFVGASASAAQANSEQKSTGESKMDRDASLNWEAQGGDTLLCSNPPAWCESVKDWRLWRIMSQRGVVNLSMFIAQRFDIRPKVVEAMLAGLEKGMEGQLPMKPWDTISDKVQQYYNSGHWQQLQFISWNFDFQKESNRYYYNAPQKEDWSVLNHTKRMAVAIWIWQCGALFDFPVARPEEYPQFFK